MQQTDDPTALVPMDAIMAYRQGLPEESDQFDFLMGEWNTKTTRFRADGRPIASYPGVWRARYLHDKRIILDDFIAKLEDGSEISYMATLRTFSSATSKWEMTFLISHQQQLITRFSGERKADEMRLEGEGKTLSGGDVLARVRFYDIAPNAFEWENVVSIDGGESWYRDCTISAQRAQSVVSS